MRSIAALALALLVGCADPGADNHGYGWEYDAIGATGLRLRLDPFARGHFPWLRVEHVEAHYAAVAACVGLAAPPPFVILSDDLMTREGRAGAYYADPALVVVDEAWIPYALAHEHVHHLLHQNGQSDAHGDPAYARCEPITLWAYDD